MSGLQFGHLKACSQSPLISYFEASLSYIPYKTLYAPEDRKISINVMLENKGEWFLTSNIRTICLMEVDFNINKKILTIDLMQCAERGVNISNKQYISRKGKNPL